MMQNFKQLTINITPGSTFGFKIFMYVEDEPVCACINREAHMVKVGEDIATRETNGQRVIRNAINSFAFDSKEIPESVVFLVCGEPHIVENNKRR